MIQEIITTHKGQFVFSADIAGHEVRMDTTGEGTSNSGVSPKKLLLAGLAGCTGIDVVSILNKMRVSFSNLVITVEADQTTEDPRIYKDIKVTYQVSIAVADRDKMEKVVKLSEEKYCGVSAMFSAFSTITTSIIYT